MARNRPNSSSTLAAIRQAPAEHGVGGRLIPVEAPRLKKSPLNVRRQSAINMIGGLLSQGVKFLVIIYVARSFPPEQFGWLSFALAVNAFLFIVGHFGLPTYGSRTVARVRAIHWDVLLGICVARELLSLVGTGTALVVLWLVPTVSRDELLLVAIFGLSNVPVAALVDWAFQGLHRQDAAAIVNVGWQLIWLGLVITGIRQGAGIVVVPVALCVSAFLAAVIAFVWLMHSHPIERGSSADINLWQLSRRTMMSGSALGTGTLLITVLVWTDTIVVRLLRGGEAAGLYAAGNRAALAFGMLANFFVQGAFPLLSSTAGKTTQFSSIFQQCYEDLAFAFVPISIWAMFYAREIITVLFARPEYRSAAVVFQVFQLVLLVTILENLYGIGVLVASHRDGDYQRSLMLTTALFIPLCAGLVYFKGILGGALSALTAQALCAVLFARKSRGLVIANHGKALLMPALVGLIIVAINKGFHLSVYGSIPVLLAGYAVVTATRFQRHHQAGAC